jgi:hypothetical protein
VDDYTSPGRLADQYSDATKLRMRQETHRLYTERRVSFLEWVTSSGGSYGLAVVW